MEDRFRYCTLEELRRDYGVSSSVKDRILLSIIEASSRLINNITSNKFDIFRTTISRCTESRIFHTENLIPIQQLNSFKVNPNKACGGSSDKLLVASLFGTSFIQANEVIDPNYYDIKSGYIKLSFDTTAHLELDAHFGTIEVAEKIETTLTNAVSPKSNRIVLDSMDGIREGRSFLINDEIRVTVNDIENGFIIVDKTYNTSEIPAGSSVVSLGFIPEDIKRACALMVLDKLPSGSVDPESANTVASGSPTLKKERTDNYEYEFFAPSGTSGGGGPIQGLTGNPEVDTILEMYMPPMVAFSV